MDSHHKGLASSSGDHPNSKRNVLNRRHFLKAFGLGSTTVACSSIRRSSESPGEKKEDPNHLSSWVLPDGSPNWTPVDYPIPVAGDPESIRSQKDRFQDYEVKDDLVVPDGFHYQLIAQWGDRLGPESDPGQQIQFGYNNDYTGILPIAGTSDEFWLFVNNEELGTRPWLMAYEEVVGKSLPKFELRPEGGALIMYLEGERIGKRHLFLDKVPLTREQRSVIQKICEVGLEELGVSILRVKRRPDGSFRPMSGETGHKRITTISRQGSGTREPVRVSGPSAPFFQHPPQGTFGNCSGGTSPWGTFLTCEENIHNHVADAVTSRGESHPDVATRFFLSGDRFSPIPRFIGGMSSGLAKPLDGRHFGWVCEVEPETGKITKHTGLGRFRHENAALRVEKGQPLAVYMGDDRRGGHLWKFVSDQVIEDPKDPANSNLLTRGTLFVGKLSGDGTGTWIPLKPNTQLKVPDASHYFTGHLWLPDRPHGHHVAVGPKAGKYGGISEQAWVDSIVNHAGKPFHQCVLGDLVDPLPLEGHTLEDLKLGVLHMDAYAMANAVGGTPVARPEDLEVHPIDGSVYIAFTDASGSSSGSPDMRVFPDSKHTNSRQYGAIYRIVEGGDGPKGPTDARQFRWKPFAASGEFAEQGGGFAHPDNLVFDSRGNLWMVTDISTSTLNQPVSRKGSSAPGAKNFAGIFGNSALFMIPTSGPKAGVPHCFAIGPCESELTGITFSPDEKSLIIAIQHPGELRGTRTSKNPQRTDRYLIRDYQGRIIEQTRTVPLGSNFPSGRLDTPPRPAVVCITRKT